MLCLLEGCLALLASQEIRAETRCGLGLKWVAIKIGVGSWLYFIYLDLVKLIRLLILKVKVAIASESEAIVLNEREACSLEFQRLKEVEFVVDIEK